MWFFWCAIKAKSKKTTVESNQITNIIQKILFSIVPFDHKIRFELTEWRFKNEIVESCWKVLVLYSSIFYYIHKWINKCDQFYLIWHFIVLNYSKIGNWLQSMYDRKLTFWCIWCSQVIHFIHATHIWRKSISTNPMVTMKQLQWLWKCSIGSFILFIIVWRKTISVPVERK